MQITELDRASIILIEKHVVNTSFSGYALITNRALFEQDNFLSWNADVTLLIFLASSTAWQKWLTSILIQMKEITFHIVHWLHHVAPDGAFIFNAWRWASQKKESPKVAFVYQHIAGAAAHKTLTPPSNDRF